MKRTAIFIALAVLALSTLRDSASPAAASPTGMFTIDWYTIDGGGALNASGGTFTLNGTIGQADAGVLSGGSYTLNGGFWPGTVGNYTIYFPLVLKN